MMSAETWRGQREWQETTEKPGQSEVRKQWMEKGSESSSNASEGRSFGVVTDPLSIRSQNERNVASLVVVGEDR